MHRPVYYGVFFFLSLSSIISLQRKYAFLVFDFRWIPRRSFRSSHWMKAIITLYDRL